MNLKEDLENMSSYEACQRIDDYLLESIKGMPRSVLVELYQYGKSLHNKSYDKDFRKSLVAQKISRIVKLLD